MHKIGSTLPRASEAEIWEQLKSIKPRLVEAMRRVAADRMCLKITVARRAKR